MISVNAPFPEEHGFHKYINIKKHPHLALRVLQISNKKGALFLYNKSLHNFIYFNEIISVVEIFKSNEFVG